ncbi:hypothetical protein Scep_007869 [Stephania cephalantha]|uniref:Uncharacterized protein n=1 Tax=Stephania cephalantha TaxID=152367 RepID=A0AAP0KAX3_9MAGN
MCGRAAATRRDGASTAAPARAREADRWTARRTEDRFVRLTRSLDNDPSYFGGTCVGASWVYVGHREDQVLGQLSAPTCGILGENSKYDREIVRKRRKQRRERWRRARARRIRRRRLPARQRRGERQHTSPLAGSARRAVVVHARPREVTQDGEPAAGRIEMAADGRTAVLAPRRAQCGGSVMTGRWGRSAPDLGGKKTRRRGTDAMACLSAEAAVWRLADEWIGRGCGVLQSS